MIGYPPTGTHLFDQLLCRGVHVIRALASLEDADIWKYVFRKVTPGRNVSCEYTFENNLPPSRHILLVICIQRLSAIRTG